MSRPVGSLSSGPACEVNKLIVQVIGKDHPADQKVVLCTADSEVLQGEPEPQDKPFCSSVLHVWDCPAGDGHRLHLEIASTQGKPIRLPLLAQVHVTPRQADAQCNQLVPVLPFVSLPGSKSADDLGTPVLARPGFVYVFYQEKLWRELEVRILDGKTTYHDVDIAHYRKEDTFKADERTPTGVPLDDIWLPARWNNQSVRDLQLCFSEIQLTAARLRCLEQDAITRDRRCKGLQDLTCSNQGFKDLYTGRPDGQAMLEVFSRFDGRSFASRAAATHATVVRRNLDQGCFPVSVVAPQRPREPGFEWMLDHPARYLCDLSGQFPATAAQEANAFLEACEKGSAEDNPPILHTELLELSAVATALEASMPAPVSSETESNEPSAGLWQAQSSVVDVLVKARKRQVCGVLLEDPRYRLRHLKSRLETHHELLQLCAGRATQHAHHASALLVQQLVVPRNLQGKANPLHASLDKIDNEGRRQINRCTAVLERAMVWQHTDSARSLLAASMQLASTEQTLADHLSLNSFDYVAALVIITQTIALLAVTAPHLDPLAPGGDVVDAVSGVGYYSPQATAGQRWLSELLNDSDLPFHRMLWPECDMARACKPYAIAGRAGENDGYGYFRAWELAPFENQVAPRASAQTTLDATVVANLLAGASLDSFMVTSGKSVSSALINIYDTLQGAMDTALAATATASDAANNAASDATARQAQGAKTADRLERLKASMGARARPVNVRLHTLGVEQLRSMLPNTFGAAYFMRRGEVSKGYYLFGLEDLPSRKAVPRTIYGEFLSQSGELLGSTNRYRMPEFDVTTAEHLVLAIPRNHSTAQLVSKMNKQLTAAQQAAAEASAANAKLAQANTVLADAVDQINTRSNAAAFRILKSRPFSVAVLMLEIWNVRAEMRSKEQNIREKGDLRATVGRLGAYADLVIALEALTVKLVGNQSALRAARKTLFEISERAAKQWVGEVGAEVLKRKVTSQLLAQTCAGLLFAGLNLHDAWYAWQWDDKAAYGYLLMAGGAIASVAAGWINAAAIFGLTPLGWAALVLIGAGAGLVLWLSHSSLEDWLAKGPFGTSSDIAAHLQEPEEAFYRLVSLLAGISISIQDNPLYEANAKLDMYALLPFEVRNADTLIRIESILPGLLGAVGHLRTQADCRLRQMETYRSKGMPLTTHNKVTRDPAPVKAQRLYADALELFVDTPLMADGSVEWAVRAQLVFETRSETHYFPAPAIKDPTRFTTKYAEADFYEINRPFWADEKTHKGR